MHGTKSLFPPMSDRQLERLVRQAYRKRKWGVRPLGEYGGIPVEIFVNRSTRIIETAYPRAKP